MSEFSVIGYATPLESCSLDTLTMKLPFQLTCTHTNEFSIKETAEFLVCRMIPRENLADNPNHLLVETSSKEVILANVRQIVPQGLLLHTFIVHLQQYGLRYYTLHDYVSNRRYV